MLFRLIILAFLFFIFCSTGSAQSNCTKKPIEFEIKVERLDIALSRLKNKSECAITYFQATVKNYKSNEVTGKLSVFDAAAKAIKGTGLEVYVVPSGLRISKQDQTRIGQKAATLQVALRQAVESQKLEQHKADNLFQKLAEVRTSVIAVAKEQGFVSAAEKASYNRVFADAEKTLEKTK